MLLDVDGSKRVELLSQRTTLGARSGPGTLICSSSDYMDPVVVLVSSNVICLYLYTFQVLSLCGCGTFISTTIKKYSAIIWSDRF